MSIKHTLPLLFNLFFITNVWAQIEITLPDPPDLPCVPATACLSTIFDTSTSNMQVNAIEVFLYNPDGQLVNSGGSYATGWGESFAFAPELTLCHTFTEPGTYRFCARATDYKWIGKDKVVTRCIDINVGDSEILHNDFDNQICEYETFRWCPGDFGIEELEINPSWAYDLNVSSTTGCINLTVRDVEYPITLSLPAVADVCGELTEVDVELIIGGCETLKQEDPIRTSARIQEKALSIFPNPARDHLNITSDIENYNLQIFDHLGRLIKRTRHSYNGKVDLSNLTPGLYLVIIDDGRSKRTEKLIVQ